MTSYLELWWGCDRGEGHFTELLFTLELHSIYMQFTQNLKLPCARRECEGWCSVVGGNMHVCFVFIAELKRFACYAIGRSTTTFRDLQVQIMQDHNLGMLCTHSYCVIPTYTHHTTT